MAAASWSSRSVIAPGVVAEQVDHHRVPDVRPVRVVVGLLGQQRHPGHEAEGFGEVAEAQLTMELAVHDGPAVRWLDGGHGAPCPAVSTWCTTSVATVCWDGSRPVGLGCSQEVCSVAGQMDQVKERLQAVWEAIRDAMAPKARPQLVPIPVRVQGPPSSVSAAAFHNTTRAAVAVGGLGVMTVGVGAWAWGPRGALAGVGLRRPDPSAALHRWSGDLATHGRSASPRATWCSSWATSPAEPACRRRRSW